MIFPQYKYKSFHNGNKEDWAIQPPTQESWNKMFNDAYVYCADLKDIFEFDVYCKASELPSFHPYFSYKNIESLISLIESTRDSVNQSRKYINSGGVNKDKAESSIIAQEKSIRMYLDKLNV